MMARIKCQVLGWHDWGTPWYAGESDEIKEHRRCQRCGYTEVYELGDRQDA
jgi:hypothetical protein